MIIKNSKILYFIYILFLVPHVNLYSQIKISKPRIEVINDSMIISYDIFGGLPEDTINITLEVKDSLSNIIEPDAICGDIGKNISSGLNKKIIWDLEADSFYVNQDVYIKVVADVIKPPLIVQKEDTEKKEIAVKNIKSHEDNVKEDYDKKEEITKNITSVSVGKTIMLSALVPGLGLTKLSDNKPYWLIGLAGTACIAGSIYCNHKASSQYDKYTTTIDLDKINTYYKQAKNNKTYSHVFAATAVTIWVSDIIIAGIKAKRINKLYSNKNNDLNIDYYIDSATDTHILKLVYKF